MRSQKFKIYDSLEKQPYNVTLDRLRCWLGDAAECADTNSEQQGRQPRFGRIFPDEWDVVTAADNGTEGLQARKYSGKHLNPYAQAMF